MNSPLYRQVLEEEKRNVGGLLLLFCVTRTVISPVYILIRYYVLFESLGGLRATLAHYPVLYVLILADALLLAMGICAGALIWQLRASGILLAKIHLVVCAILPLTLALIFQHLRMGALAQSVGGNVVPAVFFGTLWFIYLSISERVKNIYEIEKERSGAA